MKDDAERFDRIYSKVTELYDGDLVSAIEFMNTINIGLGNKKPSDMIYTEDDCEKVLALVGRIEHGIPS